MTKRDLFELVDRDSLESIPVIIALHDTQNNIVWANRLYREAAGRSLSEIEGKKCYSVWGLEKPCHNCPVLTALETGEVSEAELTPGNQDHWDESQGSWLSKAQPLRDSDENIIGAIEVAINITARKQTEEEFRAEKRFSDSIIEHSPYPMWVADSGGTVVRTNRALCEALNLTSEQVVGKYNVFRDTNLDIQGLMPSIRTDLTNGKTSRFSIPWKVNDAGAEDFSGGRDLYIDAALFPILSSRGEMSHIVCQWVDITDRIQAEEELSQQKAMMARTESIAHVGSWEWDISRDQVTWSEELFRIFGLDPAEEAPSFSEQSKLYRPEDMQRLKEAVELCRADATPYELELEVVRADGEIRYCIDSGKAEISQDGQINRLVGFLQDVTERRQAEKSLRESEQKFRALVEQAAEMLFLHDIKGNLLDINKQAEDMTGYTRDELLSMTVFELDPDAKERNDMERFWKKLHPQGPPVTTEVRHKRKDGSIYPAEVTISKVTLAEGEHIMGLARNITERREAEKVLLQQRAMLARTESITHVGSWEWDISRDKVTWSEEMFNIVGLDPAEGAPSFAEHSRIYLPEDMQRLREVVAACRTDKTPYESELRAIRANGEMRYCLASGRAESGPDGQVCRLVGFLQDITERKWAEQEREQLQSQLKQAQRVESVGRLAGGVAHDFNNMLSVILGYSDMAREQVSPDEPVYEYLEEILKAANHSRDITRQLLAFARRQPISPMVLDINGTISGMINLLDRLIGEDIKLDLQLMENLWLVMMDPSQINQIMINLCANARDAIGGVGKIIIRTGNVLLGETYSSSHPDFVPGEFVLIAVSDDGCGMDKEILENIFEPFFTTKNMAVSTGLGLATIYGIVKQNNGQISVSSEPGTGSTFRLYFPRHISDPGRNEVRGDERIPGGRGETILLVEDEVSIMKMTARLLEKLEYQVLSADSPEKALALAADYPGGIDMLITDVVLPGMNGRDLANEILDLYPDIRILFVSGYTANVIAHRGVLDDGVNFLQKPFSRNDLACKVRTVLDQ